MNEFIRTIIGYTKNVFFTPSCVGCGAFTQAPEGEFLCERCFQSIPRNPILLCPTCNRRVLLGKRGGSASHAHCMKKKPFLIASATSYQDELVQHIIRAYKYRFAQSLSLPLSQLLAEAIHFLRLPLEPAPIIIPLPLHPKKKNARGFNQSAEIAKELFREMNLPVREDILARTRATRSQAKTKSWQERQENISGAFKVTNIPAIYKKKVLLIDDISTSGATLTEAARTLKKEGAASILALVVAKA